MTQSTALLTHAVLDAAQSINTPRTVSGIQANSYQGATVQGTRGQSGLGQLAQALGHLAPALVQAHKSHETDKLDTARSMVDRSLAGKSLQEMRDMADAGGLPFWDDPVAVAYYHNRMAQLVFGTVHSNFLNKMKSGDQDYRFDSPDALSKQAATDLMAGLQQYGLDTNNAAVQGGLAARTDQYNQEKFDTYSAINIQHGEQVKDATVTAAIGNLITSDVAQRASDEDVRKIVAEFKGGRLMLGGLSDTKRFYEAATTWLGMAANVGGYDLVKKLSEALIDPETGVSYAKLVPDKVEQLSQRAYSAALKRNTDLFASADQMLRIAADNGDQVGVMNAWQEIRKNPALQDTYAPLYISSLHRAERVTRTNNEKAAALAEKQMQAELTLNMATQALEQASTGIKVDFQDRTDPVSGLSTHFTADTWKQALMQLDVGWTQQLAAGQMSKPQYYAKLTQTVAMAGGRLDDFVADKLAGGINLLSTSPEILRNKDYQLAPATAVAKETYQFMLKEGGATLTRVPVDTRNALQLMLDAERAGFPENKQAELVYNLTQRRASNTLPSVSEFGIAQALADTVGSTATSSFLQAGVQQHLMRYMLLSGRDNLSDGEIRDQAKTWVKENTVKVGSALFDKRPFKSVIDVYGLDSSRTNFILQAALFKTIVSQNPQHGQFMSEDERNNLDFNLSPDGATVTPTYKYFSQHADFKPIPLRDIMQQAEAYRDRFLKLDSQLSNHRRGMQNFADAIPTWFSPVASATTNGIAALDATLRAPWEERKLRNDIEHEFNFTPKTQPEKRPILNPLSITKETAR